MDPVRRTVCGREPGSYYTLDEIQQSFLDPQRVICVADSALITAENLARNNQYKMRFVSRLPETYSFAAALKERAWTLGNWEVVGRLAHSGKGASYKAQSFIESLEGDIYRLIVVHSSALDGRKRRIIESRVAKERLELEKAAKTLLKERFSCEEDAAKALEAFPHERAGAVHQVTGIAHEERIAKRRPGRPRKDEEPNLMIQWRITLDIAPPTDTVLQELHARGSTLVLITNLMEPD